MFKDILGPDSGPESQSTESVMKRDDTNHSADCQCEDCLDEAIKQLCDQMGINLDDEELEDIKIEYFSNNDDEKLNPFSLNGKLCIAMARKFHKDIMNETRDMDWNKLKT